MAKEIEHFLSVSHPFEFLLLRNLCLDLYSPFLIRLFGFLMCSSKTLVTAHAAEDVEQGKYSSISGRSANFYSNFGNHMAISQKTGINLP